MLSKAHLNRILLFKLPSAYFCGVRVISLDEFRCDVSVKYRWINQNPFNSMYFAVQAMAAELSTGALVMRQVKASGLPISMLVTGNSAVYTKKAVGRITFTCTEGDLVKQSIQQAVESGVDQKMTLQSVGVNASGEKVSEMQFEWSIRVKSNAGKTR